jgi:hypothetical protein
MKSFKNIELIEYLTGDQRLLDGRLQRINVFRQEYELVIEVYVELRFSKIAKQLKLTFKDIKEYSFSGSSNNQVDYIERYKFFGDEKGYYICFDPSSEHKVISSDDQDFILSEIVEGIIF